MRVPRRVAPGNARVVWGRAEEQETDWAGVAVAKALARPPTAAEWCLPLVRPGGAVVLWVGPSAEADRVAQVAERIAGELAEAPDGFLVIRKLGPTPPGLPAPRGRREETPARLAIGPCLARRAGSYAHPAPSRSVCWLDWLREARKVYAFANQKGGVGKTTTAINLAACLAEAGERALVIDLDPQANATSGLGMSANGSSSYDLLDGAPLADLVKPTRLREPLPRPVEAGAGRRCRRALAPRGWRPLPRRRHSSTSTASTSCCSTARLRSGP